MEQTPPPVKLMPQQSRLINATDGLRLEVRSGCVWLTRPGDAVDRFLVAGSEIDLHENLVLIQSDSPCDSDGAISTRYSLTPLKAPETLVLQSRTTKPAPSASLKDRLTPIWNLRSALVNL